MHGFEHVKRYAGSNAVKRGVCSEHVLLHAITVVWMVWSHYGSNYMGAALQGAWLFLRYRLGNPIGIGAAEAEVLFFPLQKLLAVCKQLADCGQLL